MKHSPRYDRLISHPDIGETGMEKLRKCTVALVGAGGLGTAAAIQLAMAGIGKMTLIDDDKVQASNLNRQLLFEPKDIGAAKAIQAAQKICQLNPDVSCTGLTQRLTRANAVELLQGHDILLDCTDSPTARYYISEAATQMTVPWIFAGVYGDQGMMATFLPSQSPRFEELFPPEQPWFPQDCGNSGVLGMTTTLMGTMQAREVMTLCLQPEKIVSGKLWMADWNLKHLTGIK